MSLEKQRITWAIIFFVMIISAFIIPFTPLMSGTTKVFGAFMFWNLFAVVVIVCLGFITSRWKDDGSER